MEDKTLVFTELNEYVSEDQLRQLKLIFSLRELACNQDIEGSTILLQFKNLLLQKHNWVKDRATPLIQSMLSIVNVREDKVKKLGSDYNILKECKDYLSYPQLVIEFCKGLTFDEFEIFKVVICERILDCTPENVKNCEKVCLMLHQQMKISEQTGLNIFLPYLTKRVDLQEKIKNYATTKKLTESIEETKHDVSNGQANIFVVATMSPIRRTTNTSILLAETSIGSHHKETITSTSSQKQHKTSHFVLPLQETKISQSGTFIYVSQQDMTRN